MVTQPTKVATDDASTSAVDEPALSHRKAKKAQKLLKKIKSVPGSVDVRVQHTNDDSVVSKRSAVAMGYIDDPFLRYFVKKPTRRAPLINRGYYLRMLVMTDIVQRGINHLSRTCEASSEPKPVQVISLGAGYDTFAFRSLLSLSAAEESFDSTNNVAQAVCEPLRGDIAHDPQRLQFFDVDFPAVVQAKAALMAAAPPDAFALPNVSIQPADPVLPVRSAQYHAVGVDLREAQEVLLPRLLSTAAVSGFSTENPTIVYAECVMQYMPPAAARELIAFIAKTFPNAIFLAYDQLQPLDSFGKVMLHSLKQKNSPLLGIDAAPDGPAMVERAVDCGMADSAFADFHALSRFHIGPAEEARLRALEAFDELEEWSEMCEHYGITLAFTSQATRAAACVRRSVSGEAGSRDIVLGNPAFRSRADILEGRVASQSVSTTDVVVSCHHTWPSSRFGFEGWGNGDVFAEVSPTNPLEVLIVTFGGFACAGKVSQRVNTVSVHGLREGELSVVVVAPSGSRGRETKAAPPPCVFHSVTRLGPFTYVVFGGRTNPECALGDAYLLRLDPQPAVGGRSSVVAHWRLLVPKQNEEKCGKSSATPCPRFRHAAASLSSGSLLVFGGITTADAAATGEAKTTNNDDSKPSRRFLNDVWIGRVDTAAGTIAWEQLQPLSCKLTASPTVQATGAALLPAVCSASLVALDDDRLLLTGGLMESGMCNERTFVLNVKTGSCEVSDPLPGGEGEVTARPILANARFSHSVTKVVVDGKERLLVLGGCVTDMKARAMPAMAMLLDPSLREPAVRVTLPADVCPIALARHAVVAVGSGMVAVVSGGYTCFSFGTVTSRPFLLTLRVGGEQEGKEAVPVWARPLPDAVNTPGVEADQGNSDTPTATTGGGVRGFVDQLLSCPRPAVEEMAYSPEAFVKVASAATRPVVFRKVPLGPCTQRWADAEYLKTVESDTIVSVHVANNSGAYMLDFVRKNFTFRHVPLAALVDHIVESVSYHKTHAKVPEDKETWYFRSIAANMKTDRANLWTDFKKLGADFELPAGMQAYVLPRLHQSCLRLNAAPLQLWTHYDTLDNILCQVVGRKRVVLFPPSEYNNLYMSGSSSPVLNIDSPDLRQYPRFVDACKRAIEVVLQPGDVLFFPANWFHHITTLIDEPGDTYSVSVNLFFTHFDPAVYDRKDLYGNKDIPAVAALRKKITSFVESAVREQKLTPESNEPVPGEYTQFALRQALQDLEKVADAMCLQGGMH